MASDAKSPPKRPRSILPGFGLSLGFTVTYLGLIVLIPLTMVFIKTSGLGFSGIWKAISTDRVIAAFRLTFGLSALAGLINCVCGFLVAWVLVRYRFPGRRFLDAAVIFPSRCPPLWPASRSPLCMFQTAGLANT